VILIENNNVKGYIEHSKVLIVYNVIAYCSNVGITSLLRYNRVVVLKLL